MCSHIILFQFYSFGLLLIATLIFLYHLVVIVAETAVTGSPFGQRFQNVWVPIRLVMALGLLVPINFGLNSAQYITLYSAKLGSSVATNAWRTYNNTIQAHPMFGGAAGNGNNPIGERETLIAIPKRQSIAEVVEAMSLVHTCAYALWAQKGDQAPTATPPGTGKSFASGAHTYGGGGGYITRPALDTLPTLAPAQHLPIRAYFVKTEANTYPAPGPETVVEITPSTTYTDALNFYGDGNIIIRFGEYIRGSEPSNHLGGVIPTCGDVVVPVVGAANLDRSAELLG